MRLIQRLSGLLTANFHALLDQVENPELMIAQIIRDMETSLADVRRHAAIAIAAERRIGRELEHNRVQAAHWHERAREALAAGREDLARRALIRKREQECLIQRLQSQYAAAQQTSRHVKTSLNALEVRLAEARRKQRAIIARQRAAQARLQVARTLGASDDTTAGGRFACLESRLNELEDEWLAEAEVSLPPNGLEEEFAQLQANQAINQELQALKDELRQPPPS